MFCNTHCTCKQKIFVMYWQNILFTFIFSTLRNIVGDVKIKMFCVHVEKWKIILYFSYLNSQTFSFVIDKHILFCNNYRYYNEYILNHQKKIENNIWTNKQTLHGERDFIEINSLSSMEFFYFINENS